MGGGTSLWASPEWKKDPKSIYNARLVYLAVTIAFAGCAYGFDQGNIGGVMTLSTFKHAFGLDKLSEDAADERAGNIAALSKPYDLYTKGHKLSIDTVAAGGSAGALISAPFADFLGRKYSMMVYGWIYLLGCAFQEVPNLPLFYAGRFLAGVAIGSMSAGAPQFLAENSPKAIRGSMTCLYNLMIITALSLAFWINYGVSKWNNVKITDYTQWQLSLGIQLIPGFFMVCMLWWVLETPRALIARGKREDGLKNLMRLRELPEDHPYLQQEFMEVCAQVDQEQEVAAGRNYMLVVKDIAFVPSNRRRFFLAVMLFLFHKFTGTDSLNYFAPEIFTMIGVKGGSQALLTTGVYGLVKLVTTVIYVAFIVDRVGRRLPLMIGASMQATAMLYIALYVRFANPDNGGGTEAGGIIGIVWIYIYAFGWSFGHSVACYVVAAEIFPSRIRSVYIPAVGFGTWQAAPGDAGRAVQTAIKAGYRHLDCAPLYWNEPEIGEALTSFLESTQTPRSDIFVTTKLWSSSHHDPEAALRKSLKDLQLDYVDLYLMHWPVSLHSNALDAPNFGKEDRKAHAQDWDFANAWALMEKLLNTGLAKAIGVANFSTVNLEKLLKTAKVVPAVNQTELHPLLPQDKLNEFCKKHGIHQTAFGPLGGKGSTLHSHPAVVEVAEANGVTTGQVLLSWGVARGWSVIPKSVTEERIRKNLEIFELSREEVGRLDALAMKEGRRFNRPDWGTVIFHDDDESVA
ncbi:hypothetical protein SLS60_001085 [Paraconiothyrium brasiliense]|uniref:Major facilitator superfamily (MFS) profile domain-containing protein n=1 Tax=Paraconiothyrium brasiliense TaxID=300254 RepID=A0ABR3S874_9PLEO